MKNKLKEKLQQNQAVIGTFVGIGHPDVSEAAVYRFYNRTAGYGRLLRVALVSNAISSIAGCANTLNCPLTLRY